MTDRTSNVDHDEIAKFEKLAARWWDPESEFKPLHDINPLRLDYIDRLAGLQGKRVLDVGCGGGLLTEGMAARGADVTGIDMGNAPLTVARLHQHESGPASISSPAWRCWNTRPIRPPSSPPAPA
jgi:2-polyprenyl-6-hydroxyphenyl methylase/3-demethylubiquinone-9 3-methyltransferase